MHIAIACGGTGGHLFPGLAVARVLKRHAHRVTLWLTGRSVEHSALSDWSDPVEVLQAQGMPRGLSIRGPSFVWHMAHAVREGRRRMKHDRPDALLAMGSYASAGPALAARSLGIPLILHEANVVPGRAVRFLAPMADRVTAAFDETRFYLRRKELDVTGMPVREQLIAQSATAQRRPPGSVLRVLVTGGSQGARALNDILPRACAQTVARGISLDITHIAGAGHVEQVKDAYEQGACAAQVYDFYSDMGELFSHCDVVVCRSGASTCAELMIFGCASLLVPLPTATRNHQMLNAQAMEAKDAADVVAEKNLDADWLADYLQGIHEKPERLMRMQQSAHSMGVPDAAKRVAKVVEHSGLQGRQ